MVNVNNLNKNSYMPSYNRGIGMGGPQESKDNLQKTDNASGLESPQQSKVPGGIDTQDKITKSNESQDNDKNKEMNGLLNGFDQMSKQANGNTGVANGNNENKGVEGVNGAGCKPQNNALENGKNQEGQKADGAQDANKANKAEDSQGGNDDINKVLLKDCKDVMETVLDGEGDELNSLGMQEGQSQGQSQGMQGTQNQEQGNHIGKGQGKGKSKKVVKKLVCDYSKALNQKKNIKPEVENMVKSTLEMVGVDPGQLAEKSKQPGAEGGQGASPSQGAPSANQGKGCAPASNQGAPSANQGKGCAPASNQGNAAPGGQAGGTQGAQGTQGANQTQGAQNGQVSQEEQKTFDLVNQERQKNGLQPLQFDQQAYQAAKGHSNDMAQKGYFDHTSPDGQGLQDRVAKAGGKGGTMGENIAMGAGPEASVQMWMNSPGHRKNILNPNFTKGAVAITQSRATQVFMG